MLSEMKRDPREYGRMIVARRHIAPRAVDVVPRVQAQAEPPADPQIDSAAEIHHRFSHRHVGGRHLLIREKYICLMDERNAAAQCCIERKPRPGRNFPSHSRQYIEGGVIDRRNRGRAYHARNCSRTAPYKHEGSLHIQASLRKVRHLIAEVFLRGETKSSGDRRDGHAVERGGSGGDARWADGSRRVHRSGR